MFEQFWQFATQHNKILSALGGLGAAITAILAIFLIVYSLAIQRQHNRLSVRPVANFGYVDFEDELSIWIRNSGVGPMKIKALTVRCGDSNLVTSTLIEQMSAKHIKGKWTTFSGNITGRTLRAGGVLHLLRLKGDSGSEDFCTQRDATRRALLSLELKITYLDIYEKTVGTESRKLTWFGRHFYYYDFNDGTLDRG